MIFGGTQLINRPPAARYSGPVEADGRPSLRHAENRGLVAVGTTVARRPPHRSVRAELPHKMCCSTFYALCGRQNYVASSVEPSCSLRCCARGRHIGTRPTGLSRTSSGLGHRASVVSTYWHP